MIHIPGWGNTKKAHYSPSLELTFLVARVFDTPLEEVFFYEAE